MALSNIAGVEWGEFSGLVAVFTENRSNERYLTSYSKDELSPNVVKIRSDTAQHSRNREF